MKRAITIILILAVPIVGVVAWRHFRSNADETKYRTATVEKSDLAQTIKATGTIQPINKVDVGSQVSGRVVKLYADFNSRVKKGQLLAQIDPANYEARVAQDKALLRRSLADIEQIREKIDLAEKRLTRVKELADSGFASQQDLDISQSDANTLNAQLKLAKAAYDQTKAALRMSETDLAYTSITSPVDGIVVSRLVNEGQTVVASLNVQLIFVIATDLKKIQVEAAVPEADIGNIKEGQPVIFTVDSYSDMEFNGIVSQVRIAAITVQNVVTYPVIITAENPDEKLYPGMTADVSIEVARHEKVLNVPNAALRFKPIPKESDEEAEEEEDAETSSVPIGPKVWIEAPEGPKPIPVKTGISDGYYTEILEGEIKEKQEVITGIYEDLNGKEVDNPFAPKFPGRKKSGRPPH